MRYRSRNAAHTQIAEHLVAANLGDELGATSFAGNTSDVRSVGRRHWSATVSRSRLKHLTGGRGSSTPNRFHLSGEDQGPQPDCFYHH